MGRAPRPVAPRGGEMLGERCQWCVVRDAFCVSRGGRRSRHPEGVQRPRDLLRPDAPGASGRRRSVAEPALSVANGLRMTRWVSRVRDASEASYSRRTTHNAPLSKPTRAGSSRSGLETSARAIKFRCAPSPPSLARPLRRRARCDLRVVRGSGGRGGSRRCIGARGPGAGGDSRTERREPGRGTGGRSAHTGRARAARASLRARG